jgi:hypothetical protein
MNHDELNTAYTFVYEHSIDEKYQLYTLNINNILFDIICVYKAEPNIFTDDPIVNDLNLQKYMSLLNQTNRSNEYISDNLNNILKEHFQSRISNVDDSELLSNMSSIKSHCYNNFMAELNEQFGIRLSDMHIEITASYM